MALVGCVFRGTQSPHLTIYQQAAVEADKLYREQQQLRHLGHVTTNNHNAVRHSKLRPLGEVVQLLFSVSFSLLFFFALLLRLLLLLGTLPLLLLLGTLLLLLLRTLLLFPYSSSLSALFISFGLCCCFCMWILPLLVL